MDGCNEYWVTTENGDPDYVLIGNYPGGKIEAVDDDGRVLVLFEDVHEIVSGDDVEQDGTGTPALDLALIRVAREVYSSSEIPAEHCHPDRREFIACLKWWAEYGAQLEELVRIFVEEPPCLKLSGE